MKIKHLAACVAAVMFAAPALHAQVKLAQWTFDTLVLSTAYTNTPANGIATNIVADSGVFASTSIASARHATAGGNQYSVPAGNGSAKSLSSTIWAVGDYYQFTVSTINYPGITIQFDQTGSGSAPASFHVAYSTDGVNFTTFGTSYTISNDSWSSSGTAKTVSNHTIDLSSVSSITNQSVVYIRLVDDATTSISGGTIGTTGTCRVDNFTVYGLVPGFPTVTMVPAATNVYFGDSIVLSAATTGSTPITYQWYYGNLSTPLADGSSTYGTISGSTSQSLALTFLATAQAGTYYLVANNSLGSATGAVSVVVSQRTVIVTNMAYIHTLHDANYALTDSTNLYQIEGIVTTPINLVATPGQSFYIQDSSGAGVDVFFRTGFVFPALGDDVKVVAPLALFNGALEADPVGGNPAHSVQIISNGNALPAPRVFDFTSMPSAALMEGYLSNSVPIPAYEGSLVVISNVFLALTNTSGLMGANDYFYATNLTGQTFFLHLPNNSAADPVNYGLPATFAASVQGVMGQSTSSTVPTNGYSIYLSFRSDIVAGTVPVTAPTLNLTQTSGSLTLSWNGSFTLQWATNVAGPYTDITDAVSPFTTNAAQSSLSAQFFRLRQ